MKILTLILGVVLLYIVVGILVLRTLVWLDYTIALRRLKRDITKDGGSMKIHRDYLPFVVMDVYEDAELYHILLWPLAILYVLVVISNTITKNISPWIGGWWFHSNPKKIEFQKLFDNSRKR